MSNFMKNAKSWLGLGQDPYYEYGDPEIDDGYDDDEDDIVDVTPSRASTATRTQGGSHRRGTSAGSSVRSVTSPASGGDVEEAEGGVRVITQSSDGGDQDAVRGVVRPLPVTARPRVVSPRSFNDVQEVADTFKKAQPVIVNLQGVDRDLSRRLIDFCSGLCYGLEGNMERVTDHVFLLTPSGAEVSDDDRRRIREGGLADDAR